MKRNRLKSTMMFLGMLCFLVVGVQASYIEHENVQSTNQDPSPSDTGKTIDVFTAGGTKIGSSEITGSNIDDYTFQNEQINIKPNDGLVKVLRTNQKGLVNDFIVKTFEIKNATPREIRNVMRRVTGAEGGRAEVIRDKKNGKNYVQVMAPKDVMSYIERSVKALDVSYLSEYLDGAADIYLKMQHREAEEVDRIAVNYASSEGFTTIDSTNNALRRFGEEYRNAKYTKAVRMVDVPVHQVSLSVKMYEVDTNNDLKLGLDYVNWKNGPGRTLFQFAEAGTHAYQRAVNRTSIFGPFLPGRMDLPNDDIHDNNLSGSKLSRIDARAYENYRAGNYLLTSNFVDFLQFKGMARVVEEVSVMVISSRAATISANRTQLAIIDQYDAPAPLGSRGDARQFDTSNDRRGTFFNDDRSPVLDLYGRHLNYESAGTTGITMSLVPYVGTESMELDIDLSIGDQNGIAPNGTPILKTRTLETCVRLLDGQTYVLGAIRQKNHIESSAKMPILGSIPFLGYLFGGETDLNRNSDVVITITPKFYLASQDRVSKPKRLDTVEMIVKGKKPQGAPDLQFGFDQWLLGG
jgi:type II secretory pathway component GspD/PulD (secretin)